MLLAAVVLIVAGVALAAVSELLARGRIRRNAVVGMRFGAFLHSEETWRLGHQAARALSLLAAGAFAASGLVVLLLPPEGPAAPWITIGGAAAGLVLFLLAGARGNRSARELRDASTGGRA